MIRFTVITARNCALAKTYTRDASGALAKSASAHMTEGLAQIAEIASVDQLLPLLDLLRPEQAIVAGVPLAGNTTLTTRAGAEFNPAAVARTNETFAFPRGAALFPIDVDLGRKSFVSIEDVLDDIERCSPWIKDVLRIARPSASSFVDGAGLKGVHIYLAVTSGSDIPVLAERLRIEQWLKDENFVFISRSGVMLNRQLSDALIYQPSRLIFEAAPVLTAGVTRDVPADQARIVRAPDPLSGRAGGWRVDGLLDVQKLPAIKRSDIAFAKAAMVKKREDKRFEAKQVATNYHVANMIACGYDEQEAKRFAMMAVRALGTWDTGSHTLKLPRVWEIAVKDIGRVKVADLLSAWPAPVGFQCADPFDTWRADLEPRHYSKCELVTLNGKPGLWSHKMQVFCEFADEGEGELASPLDVAAESLCGTVEFAQPTSNKENAPLVNVLQCIDLLSREAKLPIRWNVSTDTLERDELPEDAAWLRAITRIGCRGVTQKAVREGITLCARENRYDPWLMAVMALPVWDKEPRLDEIFSQLCNVPNTAALAVTSCAFFAGLVMRQLEPGIALSVVPVLIGGQGFGKSRFVHETASLFGVDAATIAFGHPKDMSDTASRSVVAELAEMTNMGKRDVNEIKMWLTNDKDNYRKSYAENSESHKRRFMLVGSANTHMLNLDETGNRRFMPVFVEQPIDSRWTVHGRQLLAEAKARFCQNRDDYLALCADAAREVFKHNAADMSRGVGMLTSDLDDLLPPILRGHLRNMGESRVPSALIRKALDLTPTGRQFSAQKVAQWLRARNWQPGTDSQGMRHYTPPKDYIDNEDTKPLLSVVSPFTTEKTG